MTVKLNLWKAANGFTRIYVNGLPIAGKAWLQASGGGRTRVQFETGSEGMAASEVLELVSIAAGCPAERWDVLLDTVEAMPRARPGGKPGSRASNRRYPDGPLPQRWTAYDAMALDANDMAHPIPEPTTLLVDDREPAEMVDRLRGIDNLVVEVATLEVGDYVVPGRLIVERKTAADLASSVVEDSKRLFSQSDRMASSGLASVLLLEGDAYAQTRMSLQSITGALTYLAAIQGVAVLPTLSLEHSAYTLAKLVRHSVHGLGYDLALRGSGPKDPASSAAFVLEGIPGVSAGTAKALLARFGSVAGVCGASLKDLKEVPGVGPKRAGLVHETLRARPSA